LLLFGINYLVYYGLLFVADKLSYLEATKDVLFIPWSKDVLFMPCCLTHPIYTHLFGSTYILRPIHSALFILRPILACWLYLV